MQYVLIKDIKYSLDSFSQNLQWWNSSEFILSGVLFSFSGHLISNLRTVPELGGWGSQGLITLHWELVGEGGGVCVGFLMYECLFYNCVGVLVIWVLVFTLYFYWFFYIYLFLIVTSVRTTATNWKLNCSK